VRAAKAVSATVSHVASLGRALRRKAYLAGIVSHPIRGPRSPRAPSCTREPGRMCDPRGQSEDLPPWPAGDRQRDPRTLIRRACGS